MAFSSSSSTGSDHDETFDEDMEALRRACMLTGANPVAVDDSDSDSGGESSSTDDIDLLRRLQERFYVPSSDADSLPFIKPLISRPPPDSDEEDDFETLRAIQKRFTQYESDAVGRKSQNSIQDSAIVVADLTSEQEIHNILPKNGKSMVLSEELLASGFTEHAEDEVSNVNIRGFMKSHFPKSAKFFVDALKKNRSCQKFIRRKLIEIEAKIEETKELKERLKCLMDFQVACKRKAGRMLSQKKDPRVRLISMRKPRTIKASKVSYKKVPALCFGPDENSHVSKYKMVLKTFPVSLRKQKWSNMEKEKFAKGIKQQYQEMIILSSMNFGSDIDSNLMAALSSSHLDITPEKIRSFLPLVNWDRLASMYLTGRSGAECEARWLNCEDPTINQNPWTILEDKKLLFIVQERGVYNWIDISIALGSNRTPFQCLARYQRSLNPHILNKDWTEDEDAKLRAAVDSFGDNNWQLVASNLEGRTGAQCSNRWRKSLNPDRRKVGRWSVDEDRHLKVAVMLFGAKNWNKIAQFAPGRTQVQCRERWLNCLDPSLNLKAWTEEEDAKLLTAITEHGYCWSKVATCVPPRTDSQCRRRWKVLLPEEVPLLQAARKMKRTVLISNFVDRESERPTIGPNDFKPLVNFSEAETNNGVRCRKKRLSNNQPKMSGVKSKRSFKENSTADGVINSSTNAVPADSALVCGINSDTAGGGSSKRSRKKKSCSDDQPKKLSARSRRSVKENVTADGLVNSSAGKVPSDESLVHTGSATTADSGRIKGTRKKMPSDDQPNNLMVKSRGSCKENIMADGMVNSSTETAPADLSLVPSASLTTSKNGSIKGTGKRTSSDSQPNQSRIKSRRLVILTPETDAMVNSSGDRVRAGLSAVPNINFSTAEHGSKKRTAQGTLSRNQHNKSMAKSRRSHEVNQRTVDVVINTSAETIPADASLVPVVNSNNAESGNIKKTRKKTLRGPEAKTQEKASCDGPLLKPSKKSNARKRCPTENKTTECVGPDAENVSNSSIVSRLGSPAVGIRHAKRVRNESLRGTVASNERVNSSKNSRTSYPSPMARRERSLEELSLTDTIIKGNNIISKEMKGSTNVILEKPIFSKLSEANKVVCQLEHGMLDIIGTGAPEGETNTNKVPQLNIAKEILCEEDTRVGEYDSLLVAISPNEVIRRECLDNQVVQNAGDSVETNDIDKMKTKNWLEERHAMDENTQCHKSLELLNNSASETADNHGIVVGGESMEPC